MVCAREEDTADLDGVCPLVQQRYLFSSPHTVKQYCVEKQEGTFHLEWNGSRDALVI